MKLLACAAGSRGLDPRPDGRMRAGNAVFAAIRMTSRVRHLIVLVVAFAALALPAIAAADPDAVVRDCAADGSVDGKYSDSDKRAALDRIPADLDEYSDCRSVIGASIGGGPKAGVSKNNRDDAAAAASGSTAEKVANAKKRKARADEAQEGACEHGARARRSQRRPAQQRRLPGRRHVERAAHARAAGADRPRAPGNSGRGDGARQAKPGPGRHAATCPAPVPSPLARRWAPP